MGLTRRAWMSYVVALTGGLFVLASAGNTSAQTPLGYSQPRAVPGTTYVVNQGQPQAFTPAPNARQLVVTQPSIQQGAAAVGRSAQQVAPVGYVPRHQRVSSTRVLVENSPTETVPPGTVMQPQPAPQGMIVQQEGMMFDEGMQYQSGDCANGNCGMGNCYDACCNTWNFGPEYCCIRVPRISFDNLTVFAGVQGFRGPLNGMTNANGGSFGFHEGLNLGTAAPFLGEYGFGMQLGAAAVQSNLSGYEPITDESRRQYFVTAGLFHRAECGWQGGVVFDYLYDEWFFTLEATQIRGELSYVFPCQHEWGFWFTHSLSENQEAIDPNQADMVQATDMYALFYRRRLQEIPGGEARVFGGATGNRDGLVGVDFHIPLNNCWSLEAGFLYLIPQEGENQPGTANASSQEHWNVGITLVWHFGGNAHCNGPYRPLMGVANNGNFLIDR